MIYVMSRSMKKLLEKTVSELGGLDTLVLNAAQQNFARYDCGFIVETVKDTFTVNIISMFGLVKAARTASSSWGRDYYDDFGPSV